MRSIYWVLSWVQASHLPFEHSFGVNMDTPIDKRIVLDELRRLLDRLYEASNTLDTKLHQLLGLTSLIVAISGTLQLSSLRQVGGWLFWISLIIALALYVWIFLVAFRALRPRIKEFPITRNWEVLEELYFGESESDILIQLASDYQIAADELRQINSEKSDAIRRLMKLIFVLVVVILIAMPISLAAMPFTSPMPTP